MTIRSPLRLAWMLTVATLALSGAAQMPIFKRYYIADVPGLGWTADYYFTHGLHYVAASVLLLLVGWMVGRWVFAQGWEFTPSGRLRCVLVGVIVVSGLLRVAKNLSGTFLGPTTVLLTDWIHLVAAIFLGLVALVVALRGRQSYTRSIVD